MPTHKSREMTADEFSNIVNHASGGFFDGRDFFVLGDDGKPQRFSSVFPGHPIKQLGEDHAAGDSLDMSDIDLSA